MSAVRPDAPAAAPPVEVGRAYFAALAAHDVDAMAACWAPEGRDVLHGQTELAGPDGVREWFSALLAAVPDLRIELLDLLGDGERCVVRWRLTGTFAGPGSYMGFAPTGDHIDLEGIDLLRVRDGRIVRNDAYPDGMTFGRQIGLLPPQDSPLEQRMTAAFNARTRVARRLGPTEPESIADGVWLVRGGLRKGMNVFFVREDDGVCMFDAGVRSMTRGLAAAGAALGGITRVVLGHAHAEQRGAVAGLGAPVWCHEDERADAEGDGGWHYFDFRKLRPPARWTYPMLLRQWDGGPVTVAGTLKEGDTVGDFRVVHCPGHAPGLIALFRESDRLALCSDAFYTVDPETTMTGPPRVAHAALNADTAQARRSLRELAALAPALAWPGRAEPVTGDVQGALERAADAV